MNHKPLTFALKKKQNKASSLQLRHLSFISKFTFDIQHGSAKDNVADVLSPVAEVKIPATINFAAITVSFVNVQGGEWFSCTICYQLISPSRECSWSPPLSSELGKLLGFRWDV